LLRDVKKFHKPVLRCPFCLYANTASQKITTINHNKQNSTH